MDSVDYILEEKLSALFYDFEGEVGVYVYHIERHTSAAVLQYPAKWIPKMA